MTHEPEEQYDGPATVAGTPVEVRLRGHFEPIDGRFHWWGRIGSRRADRRRADLRQHGHALHAARRGRAVGSPTSTPGDASGSAARAGRRSSLSL